MAAMTMVGDEDSSTCHGDTCARCLEVLRDDASTDNFVKVADVGTQRMLFFCADNDCSASMMPPVEWQTRADIDGRGGISGSYFPPIEDYIALFVMAAFLLPWDVLANGQRPPSGADHKNATAPRLLILGGGGGVLALLYARLLPSAIIDVVEPSEAVFALGQRYFGLRCAVGSTAHRGGTIHCHRARARSYVRRYRGRPKYDLIALDAFENDGSESATPRAWSHRQWCVELARILSADHGVLAANLYAADETSSPFRAHCDAVSWGPLGGARTILQPGGAGRRRPIPSGVAVQTVEAWSPAAPSPAAVSPRSLIAWNPEAWISEAWIPAPILSPAIELIWRSDDLQRMATVATSLSLLSASVAAVSPSLSARLQLAWRGQLRLAHPLTSSSGGGANERGDSGDRGGSGGTGGDHDLDDLDDLDDRHAFTGVAGLSRLRYHAPNAGSIDVAPGLLGGSLAVSAALSLATACAQGVPQRWVQRTRLMLLLLALLALLACAAGAVHLYAVCHSC